MPKKKIQENSPMEEIFEVVNGILTINKRPLTQEEKFRLKREAMAFKSTLLYRLIITKVANDMRNEIIQNAKTLEDLSYFRAVLADRVILEKEIDSLAASNVPIPKIIDKPLAQGL